MENHAYIGDVLATVVYLIAGVRLLRLGQRTGETPERLLGGAFFFMGVSTGLYVLPVFSAFESLWTPLVFAGRVTYVLPVVMIAVFTRHVFRPDERWSNWLVWFAAILQVSGIGGSALAGDPAGYSIRNGGFWVEWVGYTLPFAWVSVEAFAQYRNARRRMQLGLCERLVSNRYLLWALFGLLQASWSVVLIPQYYVYEMMNQFTTFWDALYGGITIASLVMIWLVFFPPSFYQNWINKPATGADAAAEGSRGGD